MNTSHDLIFLFHCGSWTEMMEKEGGRMVRIAALTTPRHSCCSTVLEGIEDGFERKRVFCVCLFQRQKR